MVAYSFQKRFVGRIQAGLEPGPWVPGMKRHTLRRDRVRGHAKPGDATQLYTGMRTKYCYRLGVAECCASFPVTLVVGQDDGLSIFRRGYHAPGPCHDHLPMPVRWLLAAGLGEPLDSEAMEEFAQADGFASTAEMRAFFEAPKGIEDGTFELPLTLVAWRPLTRVGQA